MTLDEYIKFALEKEADRLCPPEVVEDFWQGVQEALAQVDHTKTTEDR